jgi:glutathione S-transferase
MASICRGDEEERRAVTKREETMITVYQYIPAWGLPCISPYVSKLVYYLKMAGLKFETKMQDLSRLTTDAPFGKLPYILDNGTKVADSTHIINYLKKTHGDPLDKDATPAEKADMLAWTRLIDEHLYWAAVIQPRWREDPNWEIYIPYIVGGAQVSPELRKVLDGFRDLIRSEFLGQGLGRMPDQIVYERARADLDAISDFLDGKPFFMGNKPRSIDADVCAILRHIMHVPFIFPMKDYALGKKNLVDYCARMIERFKL